ncbi:MAG TPA: ferredoxin [Mycobacterium sp.]|nr:ferredoxin [Mycobacterium sp.]
MTPRIDDRLLDAPMVRVQCQRCGAEVLARKGSWEQTSVQWDASALAQCVERRSAGELPSHRQGLFLACSQLRNSIALAAQRGELRVLDE